MIMGAWKRKRMRIGAVCFAVMIGELLMGGTPVRAQASSTVDITIPASVTFIVTDSNALSVTGSPNPFTISYHSLKIPTPRRMRIQVRAESIEFTPTNGSPIPANKISWTTTSAVGGAGYNGTLSSTTYTTVYESTTTATSGSVGLTWRLSTVGTSTRAGTYTLNLRWLLESL